MPASSRDHVPLFAIRIDGQDLDPVEADFVHEIKITNWMRMPDVCTLQVGYPASDIGAPFSALDDSKLEIGRELEVRMGSMGETTTQSLFKGEIVTVEPDFEAGGVTMVVRAYDKTHRMMRTRKQRSFIQSKTSDVVSKICREHGIRAQVTASDEVHQFVLQHNETDFDFILRLGRRIGYEFTVDAGVAKFAPPSAEGESVTLAYPDDLSDFRPRITAVQQVGTVNVRGFDFKNKQSVLRSSSRPKQVTAAGITRSSVASKFPAATLEIAGQSFATTAEADKMAQSALDQLANAYLAAEGTCHGDPRIKAGVLLKINGVGTKFSGT